MRPFGLSDIFNCPHMKLPPVSKEANCLVSRHVGSQLASPRRLFSCPLEQDVFVNNSFFEGVRREGNISTSWREASDFSGSFHSKEDNLNHCGSIVEVDIDELSCGQRDFMKTSVVFGKKILIIAWSVSLKNHKID